MAAKDNKDAKAASSGKVKGEVEKGKAADATKAKDEKSEEKKDKEEELCNVYLEIAIGDKSAGRIEFKLYDKVAPKTAANFRGLCTGFLPNGTALPPKITYAGSPLHRVIPGFMVQGGDIERKDGTGGISIYGGKFSDEKFTKNHDKIGLLSSANSGPNSNGSQWFITTVEKCDWLDGKHVVFGEVISGLDVVKAVEKLGTRDGKVLGDKKIIVKSCGKVEK